MCAVCCVIKDILNSHYITWTPEKRKLAMEQARKLLYTGKFEEITKLGIEEYSFYVTVHKVM